MRHFHKMEVTISQDGSSFKANSQAFPKCVGEGKTELEAIENLCTSIGLFIGQTSTETLKEVLLSTNYTEILLDAGKKNKEHHRIFNLHPQFLPNQKTVFIKLGQPAELETPEFSSEIDSFLVAQDVSFVSNPSSNNMLNIVGRLLSQSNQEGYVFGVPFSFN